MRHDDDRPARLSLLLLSGNEGWTRAVHSAAAEMGLGAIESTGSPQDAIRRLAAADRPFSHLLVAPDTAGDLMPALVGLTAGEVGSGIELVVLGPSDNLPPGALKIRVVPEVSQGWLQAVLAPRGRSGAKQVALRESELREALDGAHIQTRYQPIVRLSDRMPVGLEVLARLEHPGRGTLPPDLFIPQIEEAGLAGKLTEAVVRRAFQDWGGGRLLRYESLTLAVNFPLDVLLSADVLAWLEEERKSAGIPAERIVIELTESRPVTGIATLRRTIDDLRAQGYGLAIDDVGPKIRDHRPLLDLAFTTLKLDKALVRETPDSVVAQDFLARTIADARRANLTIIAEGVEDTAIWERMRGLGVDQAQGFLIARPLPATAVPPWYQDWRSRPA